MTEGEYIRATNRVKVTMASGILRDVLAGADYGISGEALSEILVRLSQAEAKLFNSYECTEGLEYGHTTNAELGLRFS